MPAMTRRRALGLGVGLAGASALAAACGRGSHDNARGGAAPAATSAPQAASDRPVAGGELRLRLASAPSLDPLANPSARTLQLAGYTYSRLLKFKTAGDPAVAANQEVVPDLAAAWEIAGDGSQITFRLQAGARFHNRAPVSGRVADSEDVRLSLERFRKEPNNPNRTAFGSPEQPIIDKVETPDPQTFVVKLAKPYGPILNLFANPQNLWVLPKESAGGFDPAKDQIGTGPWTFESMQAETEVRLKANPSYFVTGKPYIQDIVLRIIPDDLRSTAEFQAERLDVHDIAYENKGDVEVSNQKARFVKYIPTRASFLAFQVRGDSPFKDERLRRAVSMAFDRDGLLQLSYDGQGVIQNIVPAHLGKWWLEPRSAAAGEGARYFAYNPREGRALVQAAGANGQTVKFVYPTNAFGERFNQWAEAVALQLKDIGLSAQVVQIDYDKYLADARFGKFDGMLFTMQPLLSEAHDYMFAFGHSTSKRNMSGVKDPRLDAMIDAEAATLDETARVKLVHDIQAYMAQSMYYAPGFAGPAFTAIQPWVRDYRHSLSYGAGGEAHMEMWVNRG